jgi:non-specific serine/threonine protein kinase
VLVVHGLWTAAGRLAIWGESSTLPRSAPRRAGRQPGERAHPFAAPVDMLSAALSGSVGAGRVGLAANGAVTIRLPGDAAAPGDSPDLVRTEAVDEPTRRRKDAAPALALWHVPTVEFDIDHAFAALRDIGSRLADVGPALDEITLGGSIRHLVAVADFAHDIAMRGRVLPAVVATAAGAAAVWRPLLTGPDAASARDLVIALPPVGRAEVRSDGDGEKGDAGTPALIVAAALDALTDAAVRSALGARSLAPPRRSNTMPVVAQDWLDALTGRDRAFTADARALADLNQELVTWQRDAVGGSVRACFRLVEPTTPEADDIADADVGTAADAGTAAGPDPTRWRVDFALQATDQPSLVVDAERVWQSKGALKALARHLDTPQETMLAELGRASRLWPSLTEALTTARPERLTLDADGAHAFLREGAPLLHAAGFGVLLPSWWTKPSARLGARLHAQSRTAPGTVAGRGGFGLDSLVDYRWELALGDDALTETELRSLAKLKTPLVRVRGQWVELDPKRLAAGLKLLRTGGEMSVGELLHTGLSVAEGPGGIPVTAVTADGVLGDLLGGTAERHLAPIEAPAGFRGTLRPYQERGLAWLSFLESVGLGGVLADDMGLGKTVQLLALIAGDAPEAAPTLLVCPTSLVGNWQREAAKFTPELRVHVHHGAERPRGKAFTDTVDAADVVITTYALAARDAEALGKITWHRVVVDEAQAIKNAATRQAAAVRALPARSRFAVTGTPVENRLADLWSIMEFASPGLLGTATAFKRDFAEPIERHGNDEAAARLRRITGPFVLRRVKTDKSIISDLPEKLEMDVLCNLTAEQASLYQAVVDDMLARIESSDGIERRGLVLATMTKLKQVCNHPAQFLHDDSRLTGRSGKLARLDEILEEVLAAGEKALLFTQYATFGGMLRAHLGARFGREVLFLHGGVDQRERDAMVTRFQSGDAGTPPLFVLSLKAGGTGLTLTAANHVVHVDRWWNPAVEDQATDRAFRIGQRRAVQVRKFVCAGTVEEKIAGMIHEKRGLAAKIVGTGEQWLTGLSTADLRQLLALESGAVVE